MGYGVMGEFIKEFFCLFVFVFSVIVIGLVFFSVAIITFYMREF